MLKENWNIENLKLNVENLFCLVCKLKWKRDRERESFDRISSCGVWGVLDLEEMQKMEKGRLKLSFGGVWASQADGVGWADRFTKKIHKNDK